MKALALAAVAALTLAGCDMLGKVVTVNVDEFQRMVEEMTGATPAEQCAIYMALKSVPAAAGHVAAAEAKLAEAGIEACKAPIAVAE